MADQKPKAAPHPSLRHALARRLGFRWVFPIGTLPIPFHPLVLPLSLLVLVVWSLIKIALLAQGAPVGDAWLYPLLIGLLLGGLMSIPIVAWGVMALGGRLIQPLLFFAAMLLLALACWQGAAPWWFAALPAAFVLVWLYQAVASRFLAGRLDRAAARFEPVPLGNRAPVLARGDWPERVRMLEGTALPELWFEDRPSARGFLRLQPAEAEHLRERTADMWPSGWKLHELADGTVLEYPAPLPEDAVWLRQEPWRASRRLLGAPLRRTFVQGNDDRQLIWGKAATILPFPLFLLFHWTAIFGGRSEWQVGFARGRPRTIGSDPLRIDRLLAPPNDPEPQRLARLDQATRLLGQALRQRKEAVAELMLASLTDPMPGGKHGETRTVLGSAGPALLGDDPGPPLLAWFCRARDAHSLEGVYYVAGMLSMLDDDALRRIVPELCTALNSRKLLLQWEMGPDFDPTPLPPQTPVFGKKAGFGLLMERPMLFVRMGDVYSTARTLVAELGKEIDLPEALRQALERWKTDGRGIG